LETPMNADGTPMNADDDRMNQEIAA